MNTLTWILTFYALITVLVGGRLIVLRNRLGKRLGVAMPPIRPASLIVDSCGWPFFLIWYGLRAFIEEMKDE